jgi:hypothetical protein
MTVILPVTKWQWEIKQNWFWPVSKFLSAVIIIVLK